ncbi:prion-like-(Q/N-rich) domain-bearing protein 25 [Saccostrea cucullata]|uniref:prion-like-(Q/N-rich) domain-bearing protein 25 n=1 Tax=Saccostrea cuccullata TaxID=36930 RepID=UPI002ED49A8D
MTFNFSFFLYFIFTSTISARMHEYKGLYCYHDILNFAQSSESCEFDITDMRIKMQGNSATCSDKCMLLSTDLHIYQSFNFRVTNISVTLHINRVKYTFNLESHHCSEKEINEMRLDIACGSPIRSGESFNACTKEVACLDDRAECQYLTNGGQGRCVCKDDSMLIKSHVCNCKEGKIRYKDTCLDGKRRLGESCSLSIQCSGSENAGKCKNSELFGNFIQEKSCQCDDNFLPVLGLCLPGNLSVGNECYLSPQCSSTRHADRCVDGYCHCQEGFLLKEQRCLPGTLLLGDSCEFNEQCSGTKNAGSCKYAGSVNFTVSKQCNCDEGYSNFRGDCLPGNLSVGQECFRSPQCTNADPAVRCVDGHCLCMEGYQMRERKCVDDPNKENAKKQKVVFKKIWKRSNRYRNTPILQNGSNLALQNVLYKHSERAVCVGESQIQIQKIRENSEYNNDPYSCIEETYNHLNDNTDLTPNNELYDFAGHIEIDKSEDTYSLAKGND